MRQSFPQVLVAQLGARRHYAVPLLLQRSGFLNHFFTDAYAGEGSWLRSVIQPLPSSLRKGLLKKIWQRTASIPAEKVTAFNIFGIRYALALRHSLSNQTYITDTHLRYGRTFLHKVIDSADLSTTTLVYGFSGVSLELLQVARRQRLYCVVDQQRTPTRQRSRFLLEEKQRWPDWQASGVMRWNEEAWISREKKEWELAHAIIAPSEYIRSSLIAEGVSSSKIWTIPSGVSPDHFQGREHHYDGTRPLRVLFVGRVSIPKGIPYLLEALRELGPDSVQGRLVGSIEINQEKLHPFYDVIQVVGRVPRADVVSHYNWADIFVIPSLFEGSALVTYEALACGVPVVATTNSGSWIRDGENGFIVSIRKPFLLAETIKRFISQSTLVQQMSKVALNSVSNFSWDSYQKKFTALMLNLHRASIIKSAKQQIG